MVLDFAGRYRLAVSAAAHGLPGPRCWAAALRHPQGGSVPAIVALLHAMIAHIHHDLAHTLGNCAPIGPRRAADYTIATIYNDVYVARGEGDGSFGPLTLLYEDPDFDAIGPRYGVGLDVNKDGVHDLLRSKSAGSTFTLVFSMSAP